MTLTKRKKLSILKKMLKWFDARPKFGHCYGLCFALYSVTDNFLPGKRELRELGIELPNNNIWCWSLSPRGLTCRKRALRAAIKKLSK